MKRSYLFIAGLLGGFTAWVLAVLSELASALLGLPGIAFSIFDWMARHMPGPIITLFIDTMVRVISDLRLGPTAQTAKRIEQGTAILVFIVIGILFGVVLAAVAQRRPTRVARWGLWGGLILLIPLYAMLLSLGFPSAGAVISAIWLGLLFALWGWVLGKLIEYLAWPAESDVPDPSRRKFIYLVGAGSFAILVTSLGVSLIPQTKTIPETGNATSAEAKANAATTSGPAKSPPQPALAARFPPVPGTRPELTDNANFYRVDINTLPVNVDGATWRLEVKGVVDRPLSYTLNEIRSRPAVTQAVTLECISNEVGGDLTSTGLWTGARLKDILNEAGVKPGAKEVYITAADGYYESMPMSDAMDDRTLLVYEMNGETLPTEHGFPLRLYIPNRFGMKQPKWITTLEVIDHEASGYWEDRGWSNQAIPPTTSVIDAVDVEDFDPHTGLVGVGGIAYAGARGISKVEVQVDNGPWVEAQLRTPPLSPLTWVQWRYLWKAAIGEHTFRVRAYDGAGKLQTATSAPPEPEGATGINQKSAFISGVGK